MGFRVFTARAVISVDCAPVTGRNTENTVPLFAGLVVLLRTLMVPL